MPWRSKLLSELAGENPWTLYHGNNHVERYGRKAPNDEMAIFRDDGDGMGEVLDDEASKRACGRRRASFMPVQCPPATELGKLREFLVEMGLRAGPHQNGRLLTGYELEEEFEKVLKKPDMPQALLKRRLRRVAKGDVRGMQCCFERGAGMV